MPTVSESAQPCRRPHRDWIRCWLILVLLGVAQFSLAEEAAEQEARWAQIRSALFGERTILDGQGVITLQAPYRALDAAVVPVEIGTSLAQTPARFIKTLYLVIDMNPVPLAAVFHFPGTQAWESLATRVRVDRYTYVRAIAETSDGALHMAANFVKASGGCSAPSLKDPAAAAAQLGRMKLLLPERVRPGERLAAQILIRHPNSSGLQFDQIARQYIPADFIQTIRVDYRGQTLFTVDSNISISEDPSIRFTFVPQAGGSLTVQARDTNGRSFEQVFEVQAAEGG